MFPNNLTLYLKYLRESLFVVSALKLVILTLEQIHKIPAVSEQLELYVSNYTILKLN